MKRFNYRAKDKSGKTVSGKVEARTENDAARLLRDRGLVVYRLTTDLPILTFFKGATNKASLADVSMFTRQFATMVNAGLPITDALVILQSQSRSAMKPIVSQILTEVEGGSSLASALDKHPKVFTPVYISLVRAGETGGVLDKILERLAENLDNQREFQAKVKGALIYPIIVVIGMVIVMLIMMIFVVPKLTEIYKDFGAQLPLMTRALIAISNFSVKFWWTIPAIFFGLGYGFRFYAQTSGGRTTLDRLKLKLPVIGPLQTAVIMTEFSRTLSLLIGAGIPILEGLKVVSGAVGNSIIAGALARSEEKVEKGFSLAYALSQESNIFPPMLYQMMAVGEETGKVDESLLSVSKVFEQESEHAVKNLTTAIEPIIMIFLGVAVGLLVIAIILPIYNLTNQF